MSIQDEHTIRQAGKYFKKAVYNPKLPLKTFRANYDEILGTTILPNNIDRQEVDVGPIPADLLIPELAMGKRTILYAHGGGFVAGSRFSARNLCCSLAHESACKLLLPQYRLAPEYPFPTAVEDLYRAYAWLLHQGIPSGDIVFAGDGSGANLVLSLIQYLDAERVTLPRAVVVLSPWINLSCDTSSYSVRKNPDPIYSREILSALALQYTYQSNFTNSRVSPILGDFSFFPPLYIQCGSEEILVDDSTRLAQKATNAEVSVTLDIRQGMWHLFQAVDSLTPQARLAIQDIGKWIRSGEY
jgi:acetyl esterase/lipase